MEILVFILVVLAIAYAVYLYAKEDDVCSNCCEDCELELRDFWLPIGYEEEALPVKKVKKVAKKVIKSKRVK